MNAAPLAKMGLITMEVNLILAGLIGFGFGFMLERAGFGSAHRLVGQWYMRDWSVFKVMFTGVVTALFGVLILNGLGLMSFEALYLNKTYRGAQIIGGPVSASVVIRSMGRTSSTVWKCFLPMIRPRPS